MPRPQRLLVGVAVASLACAPIPPGSTRGGAPAPTSVGAPVGLPGSAAADTGPRPADPTAPDIGARDAGAPPLPAGEPLPRVRLSADGRALEPAAPAAPGAPGAPFAIPFVEGDLAVRVVYPRENQVISVRDSTFLLGSVGSGAASLTINGAPVPVNPNGSFLAWLPFPSGDPPRYDLVASKGEASASASLTVGRPRPPAPLAESGRLEVDRASVVPAAGLRLRPDERVRVGVRAPSSATVTLRLADGTARPLRANDASQNYGLDVPARALAAPSRIVVRRGTISVSVPVPTVELVDDETPRFVRLLNANLDAKSDTDAVAIVRPSPGGTYRWFLHPGTVLETTGRRGAWVRVRFDSALEAWVESTYVAASDRAFRSRRTVSNARVVATDTWSDVRIPVGEPTAFQVEGRADALVLTLYDAVSDLDIINFATDDPSVRDVTWEQAASDRVRVTIHLRHAPFGYLSIWDRGAFVLRVRRPPAVDPARPLAGRVIAVDAGHPPIGSTGPTGLYEGDATLAVAEALKPLLERAGATVVMTRTTRGPVALGDRPIIARRADAEALVSIHLNAHPDGVNPYRTNGTGTYFFHDHSEPLARAVQRGMVRWMGLRDLGINYDNLALARPTWMPAILCEGAFIILPDQEAALRTSEFQSRYALGIIEGLEQFFRGLAQPGGAR